MNNENILWLRNPKILLEYPLEFYPLPNMTKERQSNAVTRLLIYYIFIIYLLKFNRECIKISIIGIIIIAIYGSYDKPPNNQVYLNKDLGYCRESTINNPMGNPLITDNNLEKKACIQPDEEIKENTKYNVYEDLNDPKISKLLYRTFYTSPVSNYPNDVNTFSNYVYGVDDKTTCKLGAEGCEPFRDERYTSFNYDK